MTPHWPPPTLPRPALRPKPLKPLLAWMSLLLGVCLPGPHRVAWGEGIPEPSLVFYGTITNVGIRGHPQLSSGFLAWAIRPTAGGQIIHLTARLTNLNNQFSYLLKVPCETQLGELAVSSNTVRLLSAPNSLPYDLTDVTVDTAPAAFVAPALANIRLTSTNRGFIRRIDLVINVPCVDAVPFPNRICDDWELAHFGVTGVDPDADPDGDGMNNYEEFIAGTDPLDPTWLLLITGELLSPQTGMFVQWGSGDGAYYTISRSDNLTTWTNVATSLPAVPGAKHTSYVDASATNAPHYFYRVIAQE